MIIQAYYTWRGKQCPDGILLRSIYLSMTEKQNLKNNSTDLAVFANCVFFVFAAFNGIKQEKGKVHTIRLDCEDDVIFVGGQRRENHLGFQN